MKKIFRHFTSFLLIAVMVLSYNINVFAADTQPVDARFLPDVTYTKNVTTRVPNFIPINVNPYVSVN